MGKRQLMPDDPEGTVNISKVTIELPFEYLDTDLAGEGPEKLVPIRNQCLLYLNRLREVIRFYTNRYWLKSLSPHHLNIYDLVRYKDDGKGRRLMMFAPPSVNLFPSTVREYGEVQSQITEMLLNDTPILLHDKLYRDALNFFYFFSFAEAIITANIALEVFVWGHLFERYKSQGKSDADAKKEVEKIFEGKFHRVMKNQYFAELDKNLENHQIWRMFDDARKFRRSIIHPHTKIPELEETRKVLLHISQIMDWVSKQA